MAFTLKHLVSLTKVAVENQASDIHIRTDEVPCLRIRKELVPVETKTLSVQDVSDICQLVLPPNEFNNLKDINEIDGSFDLEKLCRIRYNFFRYNNKIGIIFRIIKMAIPTLKELGVAESVKNICQQRNGLILVTGPTGAGKTSTLAAMVNHINQTRNAHIVTIEDPIEYLHPQLRCRITQREIGKDTDSFATGLRAALRQDPDIILIGEMRDQETIATALKAAETGHVVFSTVHTTNAIATINRIISMFPPKQTEYIKKRLAENLYATIGQRLLKNEQNKGLVLAQEIMITSPGIKECILGEEPMAKITSIIKHSKGPGGNGGQHFDQHIWELFKDKIISKETALEATSSQSDFMQKMIVE